MNPRRSLAMLLALVLACPLGAQTFAPLVGGHLPFSHGGATPPELEDLLVGDLDGDGAPDLVALGSYTNFVCRNDRAGGLVLAQVLGSQWLPLRLRRGVLADVDGDGDLDLLAGQGSDMPSRTATGPIRQFVNVGGFLMDVTTERMPIGNWLNGPMVVLDHDRDGDLDLVATEDQATPSVRVYDNDGLGNFTEATTTRLPTALNRLVISLLAATDLDRDGDVDLVVSWTNAAPQVARFLRNDGTGVFTEASLPVTGLVHAVVDIDADGDDDLLTSTSFLLNNGNASSFTPRPTGLLLYPDVQVRFGDLDGDGRLDMVIVRNRIGEALPRVHIAQQSGTFVERPGFMPAELRAAAAAWPGNYWVGATPLVVFDLDQDGWLDVVHGGWKGHLSASSWTVGLPPRALLNREGVELRDGSRRALPLVDSDGYCVLAGDLDGNGTPDLIVGQDENRVYYNRGDGTFELGASLPGGGTTAGELVDLDGDGDVDFVGTSGDVNVPRPGNAWVALRQNGTWVPMSLPTVGSYQESAIAVGDVDGDGDRDLVLGCFDFGTGGPTRLLLNDGTAHFAEAPPGRLPAELQQTVRLILRDLDGDGDLDLIERATSQRLRLSLNDGNGTFTDASTRLPALVATALAAVDIDRDGDVDLVVPGTTLINDGTARFTVRSNAFPAFEHMVDLDGTWTTVSTGLSFVTIGSVQVPWMTESLHATVPVDVDLDGDLDVVVVAKAPPGGYHFGRYHGVLFNLRRQLQAPRLLRAGRSWILSLQSSAAGALGFPILAPGLLASRIPLPFGLLGIDPAGSALLPAVAVGTSSAPFDLSLAVPADAALIGAPVHAQALIVPPSGVQDARLTGVVSDRVTR